jgi:hypothetical protein
MCCKHCHKSFNHPNLQAGRSPFSLSRHIRDKACPVYEAKRRANPADEIFQSFYNQGAAHKAAKSQAHISEDYITECVLDWFISGDIPFAQADNPCFKKLISLIRIPRPNTASSASEDVVRTTIAHGPSRKVLRTRLNTYYTTSESSLKEELLTNESKLSIALDLWTGGSNHAFMGIIFLSSLN